MKKSLFSRSVVLLVTLVFMMVMIFGTFNVHASTAFTGMRSGMTTLQIVKEMKIGWNLGNTMDTGGSETSWGNPVTTHAMIDKVKQQGFVTLRIPTTWNNHFGGAPNYTIDSAFLNRVEEIANYAFDNNMYVIINAHHENSWVSPTNANLSTAKTKLAAIWTQVANRFKNYGDYLIFETLNEPRLEGSPEEWNGGTAEGRDCVNQLNLAAVNAIRATGGNNSSRFIMCPTYAAAGYQVTTDAYVVPNNDSRIIVSIHNYSPYEFAMQDPGVTTFTEAHKTSLNSEFDLIYNKFIRNGRGVVIGESGSTNKNNTSARVAHAEYFYNAIISRGMAACWWDNNGSSVGAENFGLLNRSALSWYFPEVANAVIKGAGGTATPTPTQRTTATPTPTLTNTPTPSPTPIPGTISIACGSSSAVGSFAADQYYSGGSTYRNSNTVDVSQITSNPPPAALFNNERYGACSYTIPGLTSGNSYTVTLYFAETYLTSSGSRLFNVSINSGSVLSNFDIYASAGGQNKAIARTFTTTANSSGQIVIQFSNGSKDNAKINGISVKPNGTNPTPTPTRVVNTPTSQPTSTQTSTPTPTRGTNTPTPTPGRGGISIACGSSSAVGSFSADQYYSGGSAYRNSNTISVSGITSNPPPAALFNNERYGSMSYTIPGFTAGSSHTVTLYFAETYLTASGRRLFGVSINGTAVLSNFDIYASAGGQNKAIARSFTATANSSGQFVIQFTSGTENPKINGISIQ